MGNYSKILMFKLPNERGLGGGRAKRGQLPLRGCGLWSSAIEKDEFKPASEVQPTKVEKKRNNSPSAEA